MAMTGRGDLGKNMQCTAASVEENASQIYCKK